jgi:hypothetical protein
LIAATVAAMAGAQRIAGQASRRSQKVTSATKKGGGSSGILQQKSPAEFFADNKNIAGFDNVRDFFV